MPRRVTVLLQGPVGPFFGGLARELQRRGDTVWQICFNGGDRFFAERSCRIDYTGDAAAWPAWIARFLAERRADRVMLFGDCRPLHLAAAEVCVRLGIPVWVFEEGYLRPHYITLEEGGVNARSPMRRDPAILTRAEHHHPLPPPRPYRLMMLRRIVTCIAYYVMMSLRRRAYPAYRHHRSTDLIGEGSAWLKAWWRRWRYALRDRGILRRIAARRTYVMPLQVAGDSQILHHSPFPDVAASIRHVVASFAEHAPAGSVLVIKHHPMDRGYNDYTALIRELGAAHGLGDRLVYLHDTPLPVLLHLADGLVTVNSTAGISALLHGVPVKVLGDALYDLPKLTHPGPLAGFWARPKAPSRRAFAAFQTQVRWRSQLNACTASASSTWDLFDRLYGFEPQATGHTTTVILPTLAGSR